MQDGISYILVQKKGGLKINLKINLLLLLILCLRYDAYNQVHVTNKLDKLQRHFLWERELGTP